MRCINSTAAPSQIHRAGDHASRRVLDTGLTNNRVTPARRKDKDVTHKDINRNVLIIVLLSNKITIKLHPELFRSVTKYYLTQSNVGED
ncbi:hypothetical protein EVAR_76204_1 [Eumeta japonica]|uniref:Uncharacterized protein n=1 Tax=Eumeta variegata TaxID=151549 RepID=A0A4C1UNS4_EUMVA|nr:hypothetical protein EVAR_76204_1 [Eumeta japonica]